MNLSAVLCAALLVPFAALAQDTKPLPYMDSALTTDQRVDDLVGRMTFEEKVTQMINTSAAIPRLNVPAYDWWSEGLHGIARSGYATTFPQAIGMAATWNALLLGQVGDVISTEARAKYNRAMRENIHSIYFGLTIWSPNINIFRDPRWGRGQETYGEDPYLTSRLGVAFVKGLQGNNPKYFKVIATPKHFAVHSGPESTRHSANIDPTRHDLWDTYLPAFRATITEAHADSIMCSYNAVDGVPACASKQLLGDILRRDWGFKGYVTSDCGAVDDFFEATGHHTSPDKDAAAADGIHAGTDTNCGSTYLALGEAVKRGLVKEAEIDTSLKRLLTARFRLGMFDPAESNPYNAIPYTEVDSAAHRALALTVARQSMVLLKNAGQTLPLRADVKTIAVIGPTAATLASIEGNYNAVPRDPLLPVDGIVQAFPHARVIYAQGAPFVDGVDLPAPRTLFHPDATTSASGLRAEYFDGTSFTGSPVVQRIDPQIDFDWNSAVPVAGVKASAFAVRWTGSIQLPGPGAYTFSMHLANCYPCGDHERYAVYLDGKRIANFDQPAAPGRGSSTPGFTLSVADARPHDFRVEYVHEAPLFGAGLTLEWTPQPGVLQQDAVKAAAKADVVVAFVGLSPELEGEEMPIHVQGFAGGDRTDIALPQSQQKMLEAVAATGKPLVVVLLNGSALAVNWANQHAGAILESWYPGEAGAQAIAETLAGKNNPGGRLPVTFYASVDQLPPFADYAMAKRTYRYFDGVPLYPFGYGLSYTSFAYTNVKLSTPRLRAGEPLVIDADVENTGQREGDEVAEVYLVPPHTAVAPIRELAAFERVHLKAGERRHLRFTLDPRTLSQVDGSGARAVSAGRYGVSVGGSQPAPGAAALSFEIAGRQILPQ